LALIIDTAIKNSPLTFTSTDIRCFEKGCHGLIKSKLLRASTEIHWVCSKCQNEGVISGWQMTKWDKSGDKK
jgi:hypothetical protein